MSRRQADEAPPRARNPRSKKRLAADDGAAVADAVQSIGAQPALEPVASAQPSVVLRLEDIFGVYPSGDSASAVDASDERAYLTENGSRPVVARTFSKKAGSVPARNAHRTLLFERKRMSKH